MKCGNKQENHTNLCHLCSHKKGGRVKNIKRKHKCIKKRTNLHSLPLLWKSDPRWIVFQIHLTGSLEARCCPMGCLF